jgi:hypothetical protein
MTVYGGSGKNLFTIPTTKANIITNNTPAVTSELLKNKYNVQVNPTTKIAQVYLQGTGIFGGVGPVGPDINVGTIDLVTGKFTPDASRKLIADTLPSGNSVEAELRYFNSLDGSKQLKEVSSRTVQKGVLDLGGSVEEAKSAAQNLTGVDPGRTGNANTLAQQDPNLNQSLQSGEEGTPISVTSVEGGGGVLSNLSGSIRNREGTRSIGDYPNNQLLKYPLNMKGDQDCIKFTMIEYVAKKFSSTAANFATGDAQSARAGTGDRARGSTVTLPIQPNISDSNNVRWGAEDINAFQAIAAAAALSTITEGMSGAAGAAAGATKLISEGKESIGAATATYFAGQAVGVGGLLTRATGGIINPNTELLFQGPELRNFNFTFSLSAREPDEAKRIRNIIRFFKQGMSVKRAETGLFLKSPHTFEIKYFFKGSADHPWIGKIKECALTSCTVNYTPAGNYATYEDGAMTQYDISLSFSELEPLYDDQDYGPGGGKGDESDMGY